ncbi:hypothetical protein SMNI109538_22195 [Smaragdicoccus niigatensis]
MHLKFESEWDAMKLRYGAGTMLFLAGIAGCGAHDDGAAGPAPSTVAPPAATSSHATSTQSAPQPLTVDAGRFEHLPGTYGWVSPSRNISCGIQLHSGYTTFGCQAQQAPIPAVHGNHDQMNSDGPEHDPCMWPTPSPGVIFEDGVPRHICYHQGTFIMESAVEDRSILQYGETIRVGDMSCTSEKAGMTCYQGDRGFFLSREEVKIY